MMIENNYYVNVAKSGIHQYRIELGALTKKEALIKYRDILMMHTLISDDYSCDLYYVECAGHKLS